MDLRQASVNTDMAPAIENQASARQVTRKTMSYLPLVPSKQIDQDPLLGIRDTCICTGILDMLKMTLHKNSDPTWFPSDHQPRTVSQHVSICLLATGADYLKNTNVRWQHALKRYLCRYVSRGWGFNPSTDICRAFRTLNIRWYSNCSVGCPR